MKSFELTLNIYSHRTQKFAINYRKHRVKGKHFVYVQKDRQENTLNAVNGYTVSLHDE